MKRAQSFLPSYQFFVSLLSLILTFASLSHAEGKKEVRRPKIGLVLAGGGALGFAHVGVLRVLEEEHIPVDIVTGTSMGAIVGAAYSSGRGVQEMSKLLTDTDWDALFNEGSLRRETPYRFKSGRDREIYGDVKLGFDDSGIILPGGVIQGQYVVPLLQRLYETVPSPVRFDDLPLKFRAIIADIETGQPFVPTEGDLATVVRASMSVPAVFSPVQIGEHLYVDGGIANNLPVNEAFKLGADIVIVVELLADLKTRKDLEASPLAVSGQIISILLAQNSAIQRATLRPQDVLIEPDLKGYAATDFAKGKELMEKGETAARKLVPQLKKLAVSADEYARYVERRSRKPIEKQKVEFISITTDTGESVERLKKELGLKEGEDFVREEVEKSIKALYETGQYREIKYNFVEENNKTGLKIDVKEKKWLDRFVRVGMSLEDDFSGNDKFRLGASYRVTKLNEAGAYAEFEGEVGKSPYFSTELYQPLGKESPFFFSPSVKIGRTTLEVRQDDDIIAEYLRTGGEALMRVGRELGRSGEASVGVVRGFGELKRDVGDPSLRDFSYDTGDVVSGVVIDDLDTPDFPTEGVLFKIGTRSATESLGASEDFNDLGGLVTLPITFGRNTFLLHGAFVNTFEDRPVERSFSLGGFFNISGFQQNSLAASDYTIGQAAFYHRFSELKLPLFGFGFFAGGTFEYADLRSDVENLPDEAGIAAGSVFLGADTPLLPAYIGFGTNNQHEQSIYFAVGRIAPSSR